MKQCDPVHRLAVVEASNRALAKAVGPHLGALGVRSMGSAAVQVWRRLIHRSFHIALVHEMSHAGAWSSKELKMV